MKNPIILEKFAIYYNYDLDQLTIYDNSGLHRGYEYVTTNNIVNVLYNNYPPITTNIIGIYINKISSLNHIYNDIGPCVEGFVNCANKVIELNMIEKLKIFK